MFARAGEGACADGAAWTAVFGGVDVAGFQIRLKRQDGRYLGRLPDVAELGEEGFFGHGDVDGDCNL